MEVRFWINRKRIINQSLKYRVRKIQTNLTLMEQPKRSERALAYIAFAFGILSFSNKDNDMHLALRVPWDVWYKHEANHTYFRSSMTFACSLSSLISTKRFINFLPRCSPVWILEAPCRRWSTISCSKWTFHSRPHEKLAIRTRWTTGKVNFTPPNLD